MQTEKRNLMVFVSFFLLQPARAQYKLYFTYIWLDYVYVTLRTLLVDS